MKIDQALKILNHLLKTNQGYCFLMDGQLISRDDCYKAIKEDLFLLPEM